MVHRHPGLGISHAEIPYSFLPNRLPFPLIYAKIPIHSIAKTLPSEMLLSTFSLLQSSERSPFGSMLDEMYICVNTAIRVHVLPTQPNKSSRQIITNEIQLSQSWVRRNRAVPSSLVLAEWVNREEDHASGSGCSRRRQKDVTDMGRYPRRCCSSLAGTRCHSRSTAEKDPVHEG